MGMILTQAGQNAVNALLASNGTLTIAEMSFGGADRHPTGGEVALTNELIRKPVLNKTVEAEKTRFDARLEHDEGPFVIYEIGLHDENGTLIFIGRVDGLTKLVNAGDAHSIDVSASVFTSNFQNVVVKVDSNFAFVPAARKVDTGDGLTGGGDLSEDRTLAVDFATAIEAAAGEEAGKVISALVLKALLDAKMDSADGTGTGITELEKLILGGAVEVSTHAKIQVNGFQRTGAVFLYPHLNDDPVDDIVPGTGKALRQMLDGSITFDSQKLWSNADAARSHAAAGYEKLPSGLILQWGFPTAADGGAVTFPIAFPTRCGAVMMSEAHPTAAILLAAESVSTTGYTLRARNVVNDTNLTSATQYMHFAIGY